MVLSNTFRSNVETQIWLRIGKAALSYEFETVIDSLKKGRLRYRLRFITPYPDVSCLVELSHFLRRDLVGSFLLLLQNQNPASL